MNTKKRILLAFISLFSTACLSGTLRDANNDSLSKEEIEKRWEDGDTKDYCEMFEWYGDGTCDSFCVNADSDCAASCDASFELTCPSDSLEVSTCDGHPACEELRACGDTIFCETCESQVDKIQWHSGVTICPKDYFPLPACASESDKPCIEIVSACGRPIYCNPSPGVECFALLCDEGYIEVERCKMGDSTCKDVIACSKTGSCIPDLACDGKAGCEDDEVRYESSEECELNGRACRQNYFCNDIAWCGATDSCQAPTCGDKESVLECSNPEKCSEEFGCGQMAICEG